MKLYALVLFYLTVAPVNAFLGGLKKQSAAPSIDKQITEQVVELFGKEFPYDRPPPPPANMVGVPRKDIDGSMVSAGNSGKRLTDLSRDQVRTSFQKLAKAYGTEQALEMVTVMPICLSFNADNFAPSLKEFSEIFGEEDARKMVARNPGLLAVDPQSASTVTSQTMQFSYLVGYTRPFSKVLLPGLFIALSTPALEALTGIPLRQQLLSSLGL